MDNMLKADVGARAYTMLIYGEAHTLPAIAERLAEVAGMSIGDLLPRLPELLEVGAGVYGHRCPQLARYLLSVLDVASHRAWAVWFHSGGKLPTSKKGQRLAEKAEQVRLANGWAVEKERKAE